MNEAGLQKIDSINRRLAPALIFASVSVWFFQSFIMGSDLFWHLASGRDIFERGSVPTTDPFSHTFGGKEWLNHEWLSDVILWQIYQLGPDAVAWFVIGMLVVIFTIVYLVAFEVSNSIFASGVTVWLAAMASHWFLDIRPHIITLLLVSILLLTRHKKWVVWLWPPLIVIWTNLHAGFLFGIGTVGLMTLVWTVEDSLEARKLTIPWKPWISVGISLFSWLVNPFGWRLIGFPWEYLRGDTVYQNIIEWRPPDFGLDPSFFEGGFWWLAILAVMGAYSNRSKAPVWLVLCGIGLFTFLLLNDRGSSWAFTLMMFLALVFGDRRHLYLIALSAVTMAMATKSRRFIPLFAVTSSPLVALSLLSIRDKLSLRWPVFKSPWAGVGANLVALVLALNMWSHVRISSSLLRDWAMSDVYPEEQVEWLKEVMPPCRVLNYYNWGGFILLHAPGTTIFIDGRANTLYDEAIYVDYQRFMGGQVTASRLSRYPADIAMMPQGHFAAALQKLHPPWELFHAGAGLVLIPPGSSLLESDLPTLEEVFPDGIEASLSRASQDLSKGRTDEAIQRMESALEKYPYSTRLYGALARTYVQQKQFDKAAEVMAQGIRENPRRAYHFKSMEGVLFHRAGQLERARAAYEEAVLGSPFGNRDRSLRRIKNIEKAIARQKRGF